MRETRAHLAQVNIARMRAPLDSPALAGFVSRLDKIPYAFTFKVAFPPDDALLEATDGSGFEPLPSR